MCIYVYMCMCAHIYACVYDCIYKSGSEITHENHFGRESLSLIASSDNDLKNILIKKKN